MAVLEITLHGEPLALVLHHRREGVDPGRLQPAENTGRLQERRFAPGIGAHDEVEPGIELRLKPLKTTKMANFDKTQHR
jgi:hypothetical protein